MFVAPLLLLLFSWSWWPWLQGYGRGKIVPPHGLSPLTSPPPTIIPPLFSQSTTSVSFRFLQKTHICMLQHTYRLHYYLIFFIKLERCGIGPTCENEFQGALLCARQPFP